MSQNLQNIAKFQNFQLENLVDFEKCCKTHILLQKSEPIQPKTSNIFPKFCQPTLSDVSAVRSLRGGQGRLTRGPPPCRVVPRPKQPPRWCEPAGALAVAEALLERQSQQSMLTLTPS